MGFFGFDVELTLWHRPPRPPPPRARHRRCPPPGWGRRRPTVLRSHP